ncbi:LON peptidase substrate-binding domain-containing protein [Salinimonas lutimaris]|uniref:LON peptidase substrate-binding domain-containing protein n=1 Tax=Salinimonas lutimaris TaxID=914153 RepID=UPI0010BFB8D5|nr:LON peptidase substrate-binding domain-containing protein [Salinimonas lutimaris]
MSVNRLPLFPLTAHLLPEGRMALRIFEPRYIRMVKEVCANNSEFAVCMLNAQGEKKNNTHICQYATTARVIDFELLQDGLLGIKVAGISGVTVGNIETDSDGLRFGDCQDLAQCHCDVSVPQISPMVERLQELFERYPEVSDLYDHPRFENAHWVLNRWLELLPVDAGEKQQFLAQHDCSALLAYLKTLIH